MRASKKHMEKVKEQILDAAAEGFREEGYDGLGVSGLAKRSGMTTGAFYCHFESKTKAFHEVINKGMNDYSQSLQSFKREFGEDWLNHFIDFYLGESHINCLSKSCVVPALSSDVTRAEDATKSLFGEHLNQLISDIKSNSSHLSSTDAISIISMLAGATMLARSVKDNHQAKEIANAAQKTILKITNNK